MPPRDGPYVILTQRSPSSYGIVSLDNPGEPLGVYHTSALTPCNNDKVKPLIPLRKRGRPSKVPQTPGSSSGRHSPDGSIGNSGFSQLMEELDSVALEWKTLRNVRECICSTPFDHFSRKFHCWSCGDVFCIRCIDKRIPLKGHYHQRPVPVCRHCYKELMRTNSIDS
ncbi:myotubularin-related protein 8 [Trichonephila clavipes]|nr:myotubularin-related protein 8 [Trichonephila clavipes]